MALTIKQLSYFLAVVDTGRFTQAAALCRVAQPTLSKQIRTLEEDLGETLLTRGHDNVTPTAAGEALLPLARRIVADSETARLEIAELAGLRRGRLAGPRRRPPARPARPRARHRPRRVGARPRADAGAARGARRRRGPRVARPRRPHRRRRARRAPAGG